jgi:D-alanine-D-alanine ligase
MDETARSQGSELHRPRIAVIFGGRSSEHAISCVTAGSVLRAIDRSRYEVVPIGVAPDGRWVLSDASPEQLTITSGRLPAVGANDGALVTFGGENTARELTVYEPGAVPKVLGDVDVVFPLLHGPFGEDGTIQGLLELADVPYVGSGVLSSAISMDKDYMKRLMTAAGLPIGPYTVVRPRDWESDPAAVRAKVAELGYPVFVKPARAGSSMGVGKVSTPEDLDAAIEFAREHDPKVIIEAMVVGREIECGVLVSPDGTPEASLPAEVVVAGHDFYDFEAKYLPEQGTRLDVPARLTDEQIARVQALALATFEAMSCEGLARVDCFLREDGEFLVNEINTMPGFTPSSMFPMMWQASGVSYEQIVERLLNAALTRPTGLR